MSNCIQWSFKQQINCFRRQFAQHGSLPFSEVLSAEMVTDALAELKFRFFNSAYNPVTVLWIFLGQVMHPNPTLATTVENFIAWRVGQGLPPCSPSTGAYSQARWRLPQRLLEMLTRQTGRNMECAAEHSWRWLGRAVKVFDGSTVSMPDTPKNQAAYPQNKNQKPGVGFPLARIGVLFSLSTGAVLDLGIRKWAGKFQSELAILRDMLSQFVSGDLLLADRYLCSYMEIAVFLGKGVDFLGHMHANRIVNFRQGKKIGPWDHIVAWKKPRRPEWMPIEEYVALPDVMWMREIRFRLVRKGYRTRTITIATTLLDADIYSKAEIVNLYGLRWDAEINLRSLKTMMNMDVLRCRTPEMVRKEIWAHLLAYNLIRAVMAQAAVLHDTHPRQLSFTRTMRIMEAFRPIIAQASRTELPRIYKQMLNMIAFHKVANRPNRSEPRQRKRRPKPYKLMTKPRTQARKLYAKTR
jgi:hypothetical protein